MILLVCPQKIVFQDYNTGAKEDENIEFPVVKNFQNFKAK